MREGMLTGSLICRIERLANITVASLAKVSETPLGSQPAAFCIVAALLLASCSPKPPLRVEIPVPVRCIDPAQIPATPRPLSDAPMPDSVSAALDVALSKLAEWAGFGLKAAPLMANCSR